MNVLRAAARFFGSRWRAEVPVRRIMWHDMLVVGTGLNLLASFVALALGARRAPIEVVAAVHFVTLPYNAFLFAAVWRNAPGARAVRAAAVAWLLAMTLL